MQNYFYKLVEKLQQHITAQQVLLCYFSAETSDFIRFNQAKIRQAGSVTQRHLSIHLIQGQRHATVDITLSGNKTVDEERALQMLKHLDNQLPHLPEDPYLLYATEVNNTTVIAEDKLPTTQAMLDTVLNNIQDVDFVGHCATGGIFKGFANSLGQRNWHSSYNFNVDWSLYHTKDKAVKSAYAGFEWHDDQFKQKMAQAKTQLDALKREPRTISPGQYRVYFAPDAVHELLELMSWDGFGLKAQRTKHTSLLRMLEEPRQILHSDICLAENTAAGVAPTFQKQGFIKADKVTLIDKGQYADALISPRSAKEYEVKTNGAEEGEYPSALDLAAGQLPESDILKALDTGVYISNLWYLNYSDRPACRMTGMTRFATFWVENGEIVAPLNVMRFDETAYNIFGDKLLGLTQERDFIMSRETYGGRDTASAYMPGALVDGFTFTL